MYFLFVHLVDVRFILCILKSYTHYQSKMKTKVVFSTGDLSKDRKYQVTNILSYFMYIN